MFLSMLVDYGRPDPAFRYLMHRALAPRYRWLSTLVVGAVATSSSTTGEVVWLGWWFVWILSPFILLAAVSAWLGVAMWLVTLILSAFLTATTGLVAMSDERSTAPLALVNLPGVLIVGVLTVIVIQFGYRSVVGVARFRSAGSPPA